MKKRILYIGNHLSTINSTLTTIETLSNQLMVEGYLVKVSSSVKNKILRLLDMVFTVFRNRKKTDLVIIDTYSTQNFYYAVGVGALCRLFNIPYIPILHGGNLPFRLDKSPKLSQRLFNGAKTNIVPSYYLQNEFKEKGYANLTYIPNTIEIKKYAYFKRETIAIKLLWVRSFSNIYNPKLALDIVEKLVDQNKKVTLCMVGPEKDGSLKECQEIAAQKNLPITFTGLLKKEEWISLSKEYDIFINTTNFDNTPVSVIEAMALGLSVISTNVGGLPYLIKDNKTGILVTPNNEDAFVTAITDLVSNPEKSKRLAKNARAVVEEFNWEKVKQQWFKVIN